MKLSVIGAGAFGTALAQAAVRFSEIILWSRSQDVLESIAVKKENSVYLPGIRLRHEIRATANLGEAFTNADLIIMAIPSQYLRPLLSSLSHSDLFRQPVVSAAKGIEQNTHLFVTEIYRELFPGDNPLLVLSGPSFARELALAKPTAVTLAGREDSILREVQSQLSTPFFRLYTSRDVKGVELAGALKNVIAIAAGISDGMELGFNARSALITRGIAEIARLGISMGAYAKTFAGLSAIGDIVLTCTGDLSRNREVGLLLGQGKKLSDILQGSRSVAEGVVTAKSGYELALSRNIEMPILSAVHDILYRHMPPLVAIQALMNRDLREEL